MTPMLKYIPKTEWQIEREREERDFRRAKTLTLVALVCLGFLAYTCATSPEVADFAAFLAEVCK
jgi:hypothetical protein